ncbi:hypothetical protein DFQ26_002254 [Actinomortierella ambigua]|nr:hypothetical protein DFQ26_002254 [Actinomortierella ambigua]
MAHSQRRTISLDKGPSLGKGSYGEVFFGFWSGLPCAFKQTFGSRENIQREIAFLQNLRYKNIIQFYAALNHTTPDNRKVLLIVMEYAENGTLTKAIRDQSLRLEDKKRVSQQILSGLAYMHSRHIYHRDIKSDNVLLTDNSQVAKLSDFGLSMLKHRSLSQTPANTDEHVGTRRWMAPELFVMNPEYTTKSDVYSLGWVLWQMAADRTRPFQDVEDDFLVIPMVTNGDREPIPDDTPIEMRAAIEGFWKHDPSERPEAKAFLDEVTFPEVSNADAISPIDFGSSFDGTSFGRLHESQLVDNLRTVMSRSQPSTIQSCAHSQAVAPLATSPASLSTHSSEMVSNVDVAKDVPASSTPTAGIDNSVQSTAISAPLPCPQRHGQGTALATTSPCETSPATEKAELKVVVRDLQQLVLKDNMDAQFAYGMMFLKSKGSIQSDFEALFWFKKAAELGHPEAQFYIGDMFEHDTQLRKDLARAVHWYGKAARQGHRKAERRLLALIPQKLPCEQDHSFPPDDPDASNDRAPRFSGRRLLSNSAGNTGGKASSNPPSESDSNDSSSDSDESQASDSDEPNSGAGAIRPSLVLGDLIGTSAIGFAYRIRYINMSCIARDIVVSKSQFYRTTIQEEIGLLQRLRHPHLISFYEAQEQQERVYFIVEFADKGSLADVIQSETLLSWSTKFRLADEMTRGLEYLHYKDVLHGHLRSTNVLLTKHMEVKLADYGLQALRSASADATETSSTPSSPALAHSNLRWMAPELLDNMSRHSTKSDIYALGMVMWEMAASCTEPFKDLTDNVTIMTHIKDGGRERLPGGTPNRYRAWVERCWEEDAGDRPEAGEILFSEDDLKIEDPQPDVNVERLPEGRRVKTERTFEDAGGNVSSKDDSGVDNSQEDVSLDISPDVIAGNMPISDVLELKSATVAPELSDTAMRAEANDVEAQFALAEIYDKGSITGVEQDDKKAVHWYSRAAENGHIHGQYHLALHYLVGRGVPESHNEALRWFQRAADQDDAASQYQIGAMYQAGLGVEKNAATAVAWYRKAAERGYAESQLHLGRMYLSGQDVEQSDVEAVKWLTKAANQGNPSGQFSLGLMYENGRGVEPSDVEAFEWFTKAAIQGNSGGQSSLGLMYENGRGVEQSDVEAVKWFTKAANQGNSDGQFSLGLMYLNGRGVEQSDVEAVNWLTKAASQGDPDGQFNLGVMYLTERGAQQSDVEAAKWFTKAANQGNPDGQFSLGLMYLNGRGVKQNAVEAVKWFTKAASQGNPSGQNSLGLMYLNGRGVKQSDVEAVKWFTMAASQGDSDGQLNLGRMYGSGRGVEQSDFKAFEWFTKAAIQGNSDVQSSLGEGVEQSDVEAAKWLTKAASQGSLRESLISRLMYLKGRGVEQSGSQKILFARNTQQSDVEASK